MQKEYKINQVNPSKGALDFSYLLDAPAGKHGFVQAKNGHLYYEDGTRARFLGFNMATRSNAVNHELAEKLAGRFASLGVNVIRLHAADAPIGEQERSWSSCKEAPLLDYEKGTSRFFHPEGLDRFDYFVAKLKEKGIYIHIDLIVAREFLLGDELDYDTKVASCSKCYPMFNERLIELQQEFAKEFLTHVNPYTGLALVDEPAVITVQINNEESAIKGTMDNDWNPAMQPYRDEVQRKWNHFLLSKYDTRDRLEKAWTWDEKCGLKEEEDPTQNSVEIVHGNFYQPANDPNADWDAEVSPARYADYMEFGIAQNRRFYSRMKAFLKGIGVKVPIVASNLVAGAADVYGHIDGDIMENNCYFNHPLFGNDNLVAIIGALGLLATFIGFAISQPIIRGIGIKWTIYIGLVGAAAMAGIRCIMPENFILYIVTSLVGSFIQIPLMCLYGVLTAMTVDYNEWKYGKRLVATSGGAISFGSKVGAGLSAAILALLLQAGNYDARNQCVCRWSIHR